MAEYICPHCKKPVYDDEAMLCLYCGESLMRDITVLGRLKNFKPRIIFAAAVLIICAAFLLLIIRG